MKVKFILLTLIMIISTFILATYASTNDSAVYNYPEPEKRNPVPVTAKWNSEVGEYYNAADFKWNSQAKRYEPVDKGQTDEESISEFQTEVEWLEENKNTDDVLDKAIIDYNNRRIKESQQAIRSQDYDILTSSKYNREDDKALEELTQLGLKYVPDMIAKIESYDLWNGAWMEAISGITGLDGIIVSVSQTGSDAWLNQFKEKMKNARLAINDSAQDKGNAITDVGLFAVPYLIGEIKSGNEDMIVYLPVAASKLNEEYAKMSKDEWISWYNKNSSDFEKLKNVVERIISE